MSPAWAVTCLPRLPLAACRTGWLRAVRAVGGHHVPRDLQSVHPCVPPAADRNVCFAGVGRDFGCTAGPWLVGRMAGDTVRSGLLPALVFPALLFAGLLVCRTRRRGVAVKR